MKMRLHQTRCATDTEIAKYWMPNGFVQIDWREDEAISWA